MADFAYFYNDENGDRLYDADSFSNWLRKFFTTGVFNGDLIVTANGNMTISVSGGYANIDGKVKFFDNRTVLTVENADPTYNRIDTVVVERNDTERDFILKVVKGGMSTDPLPTAPIRENGIYQLVIANIYVEAGVTSITQDVISDTKADKLVCGIVTGTVEEMDFTQLEAQFYEWFNEKRGQLDGDIAGHLQNEIDDIKDSMFKTRDALSLEEISAGTPELLTDKIPQAGAVYELNNNLMHFPDYTNVLATIDANYSVNGLRYTATQDCFIAYSLTVKTGMGSQLFVDGKIVASLVNQSASTSSLTMVNGIIPVKKGSVVTSRTGVNDISASITVYGIS